MPKTSVRGLAFLGTDRPVRENDLEWGGLAAGTQIIKAEPLFPRIDDKAEG